MNQIVLDASKKKSLATLSIYKNKNNFHWNLEKILTFQIIVLKIQAILIAKK
jgi:hypothetical protein